MSDALNILEVLIHAPFGYSVVLLAERGVSNRSAAAAGAAVS